MNTPYDHMNEKDPVVMKIGFDALADRINKMNYGTIRFLAALVRARKREFEGQGWNKDELAEGIEALLKKGLF